MRAEDLEDTARLLRLHEQAVARGWVGSSEADRLRFVAAAEHALVAGEGNPPGLFVHLVRGRRWRHLTQGDEDRASVRLKRERRCEPAAGSRSWAGLSPAVHSCGAGPSGDALVVREVRVR